VPVLTWVHLSGLWVADKASMENLAPVVARWPEGADQPLMAELLETLQRMVRRGYLPTSLLLVQLTDGRVKLDASIEDAGQARDRLRRMGNEFGPARTALWISVERAGPAVQLAVESLTGPPQRIATGLECGAPAVTGKSAGLQVLAAGEGSKDGSGDGAASSRKRAMRAASFGITTGWLPKVDSSWRPPGARSSPVW
jgi:hypothetical protein